MNSRNERQNTMKLMTDALVYPMLLYSIDRMGMLGHELSHALIPIIHGKLIKIHVSPKLFGGGNVLHYCWDRKYNLIITLLGPVGGIVTTVGLLKASNIYNEYKCNTDTNLKKAIDFGIRKPAFNELQHPMMTCAAILTIINQAYNFFAFNNSDGDKICHYFNLSRSKKICSAVMSFTTIITTGYLCDLNREERRNSIAKSAMRCDYVDKAGCMVHDFITFFKNKNFIAKNMDSEESKKIPKSPFG